MWRIVFMAPLRTRAKPACENKPSLRVFSRLTGMPAGDVRNDVILQSVRTVADEWVATWYHHVVVDVSTIEKA